ncbi:MAG: hypothetical protein P8J87_16625 [Verrucomicrobiales bacterium]|nr:hypothetical protein [Verrucomicrobiales bacterium]
MFDYDEGNNRRGGDRDQPEPLITEKLFSERKTFFLDLKENDRGRFLKITEDVRGRRDTIMVPEDVFEDLYEALGRVIDYDRGGRSDDRDDRDDDPREEEPRDED